MNSVENVLYSPRGRPGYKTSSLIVLFMTLASQSFACEIISPTQAFVDEPVTLKLTCPQSFDSVSWVFGDGTTRTPNLAGDTVSHLFTSPGEYPVLAYPSKDQLPGYFLLKIRTRPTKSPSYSTSTILSIGGDTVIVVNPDHGSVTCLNHRDKSKIWETEVGKNPRTLASDENGKLYVAIADEDAIYVISIQSGALLSKFTLPHGSKPYGVIAPRRENYLLVSLESSGQVFKLSRDNGDLLAKTAMMAIPTARAMALTYDHLRLFVARFISPKDRGEVYELNPSTMAITRTLVLRAETDPALDHGANGRGIPNAIAHLAISPDGQELSLVAKKDNTLRGLSIDGKALTFESTIRSILCRISLKESKELDARRLDIDNRSLPSTVIYSRDGGYLFLALEGTGHVHAIFPDGRSVGSHEPDTVTEKMAEKTEIAPFGLALPEGDSLILVHYFLTREVGVYQLSDLGKGNTLPLKFRIPTVAKEVLSPQVHLGKKIFYDASNLKMGGQGYTSCIVCHLDGATDNRVFDFTDRGEGLRRTTSLLGRGGTLHGPVHWSANFDEIQDFEHDMRGPFAGKGLMTDAQFNSGTRNTTLGDKKAGVNADLDALAAYVTSLTQYPKSPFRNPDGSNTDAAKVGRKIFHREDVGCAKCHSGPHFTDSQLEVAPDATSKSSPFHAVIASPGNFLLHDVGTLSPASGKRLGKQPLPGVDTPTLIGIWATSPYFHDGSSVNLRDVLTTRNSKNQHGKTTHLSESEIDQLLAFLLELENPENADGTPIKQAFNTRPGLRQANTNRWPTYNFFPHKHTLSGRKLLRN